MQKNVAVNPDTHQKLRIMAAESGKSIKQIIDELVSMFKEDRKGDKSNGKQKVS